MNDGAGGSNKTEAVGALNIQVFGSLEPCVVYIDGIQRHSIETAIRNETNRKKLVFHR